MAEQFPLDLPHQTAYGAADYLASDCNLAGRRLVENWRDWPQRAAAIWGGGGAGKTHLAEIWRAESGGARLDLAAFRALDLSVLESSPCFVLDLGDAAIAAGDERPLFHLLNLVRERQGALLIVARMAPSRWPVSLADLASRLRALPMAEATAPDDGLFAAVLAKGFADRQLVVDRQTVDYLTMRSERSFAAAHALVKRLDQAALARRRRINVKLAGEVLAAMAVETEQEG